MQENQIMFNREDTVSLIEYYKKLYNLQIVGWFINKELSNEVPTLHFLLNEFRSSHFILLTGEFDYGNKDLILKAYEPLANKQFNTCFGAFGEVAIKTVNG